jgi:hypothetical protein
MLRSSVDADTLFYWHPLLMTIGVVLFLSHGPQSLSWGRCTHGADSSGPP